MNVTSKEAIELEDEDSGCRSTLQPTSVNIQTLPFAQIPQQSRLFLDYLQDPLALRRFYPNAVRFHHQLTAYAPESLARYTTSRDQLCLALMRTNTAWGAGEETLQNIERLRSSDAVAVVTGQQIGLFTGPLYTIYKALTAVRVAACLAERGTPVVPIFWMASEDHDWAEVQTAEVVACDGRLARVEAGAHLHQTERSVGEVVLDDSISLSVDRLFDVLPTTEFTPALRDALRDAYAPGRTYTEAFARLLTHLTARFGLILLDPLDRDLKLLAAPLYAQAARRAPELAARLAARSEELTASGYHAQVLATPDAFPLFIHTDADDATPKARRALVRMDDGRYEVKGAKPAKGTRGVNRVVERWSGEELAEWAEREPERFSPNVTLRAVVQDYLLPTVCYIGGAAEVSYFAQISEAYSALDRPVTPILARSSLTIVEPRFRRTLERYDLELSDLFGGFGEVSRRVVEEHLGASGANAFREAEQAIEESLKSLKAELAQVDPTLAGAIETGRKKINYQIESLRTRFIRAQMQRNRAAHRQLERLFTALYPEHTLQERRLNVASLLARHGDYCMTWLYNSIDLNTTDHEIIYL